MDGELDIDSIDDNIIDDLRLVSGVGGAGESTGLTPEQQAERRTKQRQQLKAQQKDGTNRVLHHFVKSKRGCVAAAAKA